MGPEGAFITGSDFLMDGGVTAAYRFGDLAPQPAIWRPVPSVPDGNSVAPTRCPNGTGYRNAFPRERLSQAESLLASAAPHEEPYRKTTRQRVPVASRCFG
jgi:hypothetical protein